MSATTATLADPARTLGEPPREARRVRAVLDLARFEARELLYQAPMLVFFVLYAGFIVLRLMSRDGMDAYPVLNTVDRRTQMTPLLFAVALLVCANAAVLRSRKHGTVQQFGVLAMEPWRRILAHLLSVVPYAALTAVAVAVEFGWEALKPGAVGHGSFGELAIGPLTVLFAGVVGVLLACLLPAPFVPLLFVIAFYVVAVLASAVGDAGRWEGWLSPVVFGADTGGDPVPSDLLGRPAGWHALYVTALCVLLACAALLVAGGRTRVVKAATALALAAVTAGAIGQSAQDTAGLAAARTTASDSPQKVQSCATHDGSWYCAFPEWSGVRSEWAEVVGRVRSLAGGDAANASLTVRQRIDARDGVEVDASLTPSTVPGRVTVGTRWGGNRVPEFAVGVATVLVAGTEAATEEEMCRDARPVTIMWLVLGADPTPSDTFRHVRLDDSTEGSGSVLAPTNGLSMTAAQTTVVRELLERPRAEVTARVKAHWAELTSTATSPAEAAKLLGVAAPQETEGQSCEE
ncbi:ABC transporter permease [Streptomyces sp. ID05-04B]|uniref:ABC transporter permease n=1 Tax=Streptomyces sp. ID05-04B TaxID=3028661 RepID=UPI0029C303D2|nr:ABC transporter permease [Streptomyces sp. ID05-04B]MDX5570699.1 ABC transporter permease [Streptomyces sp. ID05-04B]